MKEKILQTLTRIIPKKHTTYVASAALVILGTLRAEASLEEISFWPDPLSIAAIDSWITAILGLGLAGARRGMQKAENAARESGERSEEVVAAAAQMPSVDLSAIPGGGGFVKALRERANRVSKLLLFGVLVGGGFLLVSCVRSGLSYTAVELFKDSTESMGVRATDATIEARLILVDLVDREGVFSAEEDEAVRGWLDRYAGVNEDYRAQLIQAYEDLTRAIESEKGKLNGSEPE